MDRNAATFLQYINQKFDTQFGIRGKMTKLKLDMNRDFAPELKKQMVTKSWNASVVVDRKAHAHTCCA